MICIIRFPEFFAEACVSSWILPTKVICLSQAINEDELKEDEEYEDILDDMRGEGEKYGTNLVSPFAF